MVLSKDVKSFYNEYGWVDGIITSIRWSGDLFDLLIAVYTYEGKEIDGKNLTIRLKSCLEANFTMTKYFCIVPKSELKDYVLSWNTITNCNIEEDDGFVKIAIKTADHDSKWLVAKCEEVWVEDEKE